MDFVSQSDMLLIPYLLSDSTSVHTKKYGLEKVLIFFYNRNMNSTILLYSNQATNN